MRMDSRQERAIDYAATPEMILLLNPRSTPGSDSDVIISAARPYQSARWFRAPAGPFRPARLARPGHRSA